MHKVPEISVIIPTFNRAQTVPRALDSVLKQSFRDFEVIIVDDGSDDETESVIEAFCERRGADVTYLKQENAGVSAARNRGIRNAQGRWIAFLDSDDEWLPHKLQVQAGFVTAQPGCRIVHGEEVWMRNGVRVNAKRRHRKSGGYIFQDCLPLCVISPSAVMIQKALLIEMGLFDEGYPVCEDYDLWLKISSLYAVGFISDPIIVKYGGHPDQLSRKFVAIDYWRVKALDRILAIRSLSPRDREAARGEIAAKGNILTSGYRKRGNQGPQCREIEAILNRHFAERRTGGALTPASNLKS